MCCGWVNTRKKAIRDLQFLQQKLNEHLDELDQYAKTKGKNVPFEKQGYK